jgi:hypothetical protein
MPKKKEKVEAQPETPPPVPPPTLSQGLVRVEALSEEEFKRLTQREVDIYTKTAIDIVNAVVESDKPLRFTINESLDLETLIRKLDYRVRKFNKKSAEFRVFYRVYANERQIVAWKTPK